MGHCRDCSFYRAAKPPSELLAAAIASNDAAVLTALGKIQEDEKELLSQEQMFRGRVEQRGQATWGMRPLMSAYCGLEETADVFHVAEIRNRGLQCEQFTTKPAPVRDCGTCAHRVIPSRVSEDVQQEQTYAWMSSGKAATGSSASMIENLWKEHLQSSANRRANEVRDAYQRKGVLAVEPNYFDYCRHFSGEQRFVLCGLQNPYASCTEWTSASSAAASTIASTTVTATSGLDVGALFGLATPEPEIPEQFRALAEDFIDFAGCILGITLTDAQINALRRELTPVFTSPPGPAAHAVTEAVASFQPAKNADVQSRHAWRQRNQPGYLQQLRGSDEPLSRMLLQWHADATQVLVPGSPPLAREAAESWVELIAFASTARTGLDQTATLPADVEARIAQLAGDYPRLSARQRSMIALAPITLYELRRAWPAMSGAQRQATESQLETQLGVTSPPAPSATVPPRAPVAPPPQTRPPQADETPLSRLTREFAEAQARGDHQTAAKLQMQIQIELQNQTARLEMESSVAKMYHEMSMSIINNMK